MPRAKLRAHEANRRGRIQPGALHAPVRYKPVETDGAARAARLIAQVLENRWWVQR